MRAVQEEERKAGLQVKQIAAKLQMQRHASMVLDLYMEHAQEISPNPVEGRQWAANTLRSHLDCAHKIFIGAIPKGTKLPTIMDLLTDFFSVPANLTHAAQVLELAEDVAIADSIEDEPLGPAGMDDLLPADNTMDWSL